MYLFRFPLIGSVSGRTKLKPLSGIPGPPHHCPVCSVPGLFSPDLGSIPAAPYLSVPAGRAAKLRPLIERAENRLRVGIVWSGSTTFKANQDRATPLRAFLDAFALPGVQLYSLQKGPPEAKLRALPAGASIIDLAPVLADFADTAAAIAQLDLVIMTDSAVAHLAGAMGRPVYVLLGHVAYWLWLLDRTDSPWYPSVRLFRPRGEGDWAYVFDSAATALLAMVPSRFSPPRCPAFSGPESAPTACPRSSAICS
ncbi:MAG: hypothetical protein HQL37_04245 [Alphaproteobacteria bacterium]|nr:hypothetical protein [Alphaproteobacteria bacterium]